MCGEYRIYPVAMLEVEPSDCFDKEIARKTVGSRVIGWNGDTFLTSKHCTVQRKDECRNILFVWLSFFSKIGTFRRGNDLCFRVDCYQTSLGSWWFWVMSQKSSRQRKQAEIRLIIHACHATNMCLTNHLFPEEKNPKQTRSSLRPTKKQKHCAFKGHLSKPVPSQSTKMAPFHSHSRGKAMVQVARTVAIEAHILELGRAVSDGERQR